MLINKVIILVPIFPRINLRTSDREQKNVAK